MSQVADRHVPHEISIENRFATEVPSPWAAIPGILIIILAVSVVVAILNFASNHIHVH